MIAKVCIFLAAVAAVYANGLIYGHGGLLHSGTSVSSRKQDAHGNYAFGYDIVDGKGAANSRSEVGDGKGNAKGSYTLKDVDGRARRVDYVADAHGFRASVKTNEPGTADSAPAAAHIASPYAGPVAPVDYNHAALALGGHGLVGAHSLGHGVAYNGLGLGHGVAYNGLGLGHLGYGGAYGLGHGLVGYGGVVAHGYGGHGYGHY